MNVNLMNLTYKNIIYKIPTINLGEEATLLANMDQIHFHLWIYRILITIRISHKITNITKHLMHFVFLSFASDMGFLWGSGSVQFICEDIPEKILFFQKSLPDVLTPLIQLPFYSFFIYFYCFFSCYNN